MQVLISSILLITLGHSYAQSIGTCRTVPVTPDFDSSRYLGKWYEIERLPFIFEKDLQCVTATYTVLNETAFRVENYGYNTVKQKDSNVIGYAFTPNSAEPNKLKVVLPVVVGGITIMENTGDYIVVATDYDKYALVYSCSQIIPGLIKFEISWILSRTKTLDSQTVQQLKDLGKSLKIDVSKYELIDQSCN
ncbi:apolipo D-like [Brachionus plicatilis]|uniref:Apolipoprotein D n=1 Tax=Brachionus plicatilis TaxID=10195 RepID=A0A3M7SGR1_BRAPC|nr:apolipo D-like [Brachionus plicatilis]